MSLWLVMAFLVSLSGWESAGGAGMVLTLLGVWLRWRSQWAVADVEEDLKNNKLDSDRAHRRIWWIEKRSIALIGGGLGLMVIAVVGLNL